MDTIAAIATAQGSAAIGVLRVSGDGAFAVLDRVFFPAGRPMDEQGNRRMVYGELRNGQGEVIDRCLAARFAAPASYTGEDSTELYCHGGALRRRIEAIYDRLMDVTARFYAVVDYPDDEIGELEEGELRAALTFAEGELKALLGTFSRGRVLKSGVKTALLGAPNAGKSSLLNALVGYDRAIVTDIPGTTRDTVEETAELGGVPLRLIDTAGLRKTEDAVERLGVERTKRAAEEADLILALVDGSAPPQDGEIEDFFAPLELAATSGKPWLLLQTKSDLGGNLGLLLDDEGWSQPEATISLSSMTHEGFDRLAEAVHALYPLPPAESGTVLTNPRQADAVERALKAVTRARSALDAGFTPDAVLTDGEDAVSALGELTGKTLREDLVHAIFSRFCVGK